MVVAYGIGLAVIIIMLLISVNYKSEYRKSLNKRKHPLSAIYSMVFIILDKTFAKKLLKPGDKVDTKLYKINVKEDIREERYLYVTKKLALCIIIVIVTLILGIGVETTEKRESSKSINMLLRNEQGQGEVEYNLSIAGENVEKQTVDIVVKEKELTVDETYALFEKIKKNIVQEMLGENDSVNKVSKPLNFISTYGDEGTQITWSISNSDLIDYDGKISTEARNDELVEITMTLTLQKVSVDYTMNICIKPNDIKASMEQSIQSIIDESDTHSKRINLPKEINGVRINYFTEKDATPNIIVSIGLLLAVIMYFLKDKELNDDIKRRNKEMLIDYSEIVSKVLWYNTAGMSLRTSFERIVNNYKKWCVDNGERRFAYEEMEMMLVKIKSGISDGAALNEFGRRCGLHCYVKFSNILEQNLRRGTNEMQRILEMEVMEALQDRKNNALKEGEEAGTKLLGPMIIMLIISMTIIVVPAFLAMKV